MALKALSSFSLLSLSPLYSPSLSSPPPSSSSPSSSSLFKLKPSKSLAPLLSSQSPILLPHLEQHQLNQQPNSLMNQQHPQQQHDDDDGDDDEDYPDEENEDDDDDDELEMDPIRAFFKFHPNRQRRRPSRHISPIQNDPIENTPFIEDPEAALPTSKAVEAILTISRNLPENSSLEICLAAYVGKISEDECVELLGTMVEEGSILSCLTLFEWMRMQEPSLVSPRACSVIFPALGMAGMGEELMVLFENLPKLNKFMDVGVYNAAIVGLAAAQRYDDVWRVYEALEANNIMPDHITCSILISVIRKSGKNAKDAWEFFQRMNRKGVNYYGLEVFGALIKCFCDEGLKKEALIILSEMEKKGISSNASIYSTLMNAYVKSNQIEAAEGLLVEMKEKGIEPTTATYNTLMNAYSRRMQPKVIEDLLLEMHALGLKPNVKSYTCLISAYGRQRQKSDMAADSFSKMKKAGIKPTAHSYTALIHAYSVGGWQQHAYATYESMIRDGIKPTLETYTTLLDAFRRAGDTQTLMEIWRTMMNDKVGGTRVTFNIVLDGLAKNGLYVQARDVILEFGRLGFQPTVMTYNMLMNAYARGGQHYKLPQLLKEMSALNLKPDTVTYTTMIYAYVRARDFERAFYYFKQMVKSGQVPDGKVYHKLRTILDEHAKTKNKRDRSAILGIVNSKVGIQRKKGKKDEFWKGKKRQSRVAT